MERLQTQADWVGLLEALYALEQPQDEWLSGVLRAASHLLGRGNGIGAVLYDASTKAKLRLEHFKGLDISPEWFQVGIQMHTDPVSSEEIRMSYRKVQCSSSRDYLPATNTGDVVRVSMQRNGIGEIFVVNGVNPTGVGFALYTFSACQIRFSEPERELLPRIASHLATAYRLRRRLDAHALRQRSGVEAILTLAGRVEHVEGVARSAKARASLVRAAVGRERLRTRGRREQSERAVNDWKGLVTGRWSLIERVENDGKRYLLARENVPATFGPPSLSPRESQVASLAAIGRSNKIIAYELGLAHSTVRVLLARAANKLGARTRAQLIAIVDNDW